MLRPETAPPLWQRHQARLAAYAQAAYNYDPEATAEHTAARGWQLDDYETELTPEAPGPPAAGGSFRAGQDVLRRYSFPPPDLITGIFTPDGPLENRVMLLRGRFLFFTFWFGVRVRGVVDEPAQPLPAGGAEAVWGYGYRTLEGHFERGQIDFTLHKNLASGRVQFRIHAVSQTGRIRNPFYWLGFKIFGRYLQRKFARESLRRMQAQVAEAVAGSQHFGASGV